MKDFHLNKGVPILDRNIDLLLQQIDMLFDTNPREVLGDLTYGTRYDKYLYNLNIYHLYRHQLPSIFFFSTLLKI